MRKRVIKGSATRLDAARRGSMLVAELLAYPDVAWPSNRRGGGPERLMFPRVTRGGVHVPRLGSCIDSVPKLGAIDHRRRRISAAGMAGRPAQASRGLAREAQWCVECLRIGLLFALSGRWRAPARGRQGGTSGGAFASGWSRAPSRCFLRGHCSRRTSTPGRDATASLPSEQRGYLFSIVGDRLPNEMRWRI